MQTIQEHDFNQNNNSYLWSNIQFLLDISCEAWLHI